MNLKRSDLTTPPPPTLPAAATAVKKRTPIKMSSSVNLRTVYAFAREMYQKNVTTPIQYGTAGFRTRYVSIKICDEDV